MNEQEYENQNDWEDREFAEILQLNILKTAAFLNDFDQTVRSKIAKLNERINKLEREVEYFEAVSKSVQDRPKTN